MATRSPDLVITADKPFALACRGPRRLLEFHPARGCAELPVKAIEIRPGNVRTVHHANLLVDRSQSLRYRESQRRGFRGMDLTIPSDTFDPDSHFLF